MSDNLKVQVAKDVLKHINAVEIRGNGAGYFHPRRELGSSEKFYEAVTSRDLDKLAASCEVCAIGAIYLSSLKLNDAPINYDARDKAAGIFGEINANRIEAAFECYNFSNNGVKEPTAKFGEAYKNDKDRLRAIMENIIVHDGEFVPAEAA